MTKISVYVAALLLLDGHGVLASNGEFSGNICEGLPSCSLYRDGDFSLDENLQVAAIFRTRFLIEKKMGLDFGFSYHYTEVHERYAFDNEGYDRDTARVRENEFILENLKTVAEQNNKFSAVAYDFLRRIAEGDNTVALAPRFFTV
jgi:hypothetical protein